MYRPAPVFSSWQLRSWLVGSKGLSVMVSDCDHLRQKQCSEEHYSTSASSTTSSASRQQLFLQQVADHRSIVLRYSKLLVHSSSWELLSPSDILCCLSAASLPLHFVQENILSGGDGGDDDDDTGTSSSAEGKANNNNSNNNISGNLVLVPDTTKGTLALLSAAGAATAGAAVSAAATTTNGIGDAAFSERVWRAALPSLSALWFTFHAQEMTATIRVAHRLGVAVAPWLIHSCAEKLLLATDKSHQRHHHLRHGGASSIRTAHALISQLSLLLQQQERHWRWATEVKRTRRRSADSTIMPATPETAEISPFLYSPDFVSRCSSSTINAVLHLLELSAEADSKNSSSSRTSCSSLSWLDLCTTIEAVSLAHKCSRNDNVQQQQQQQQQQGQQTQSQYDSRYVLLLKRSVTEMITLSQTLASPSALASDTSIANSAILLQHGFQCIPHCLSLLLLLHRPPGAEENTGRRQPAVDLYVSLTSALGKLYAARKRSAAAAAAPVASSCQLVLCAIEMEKAAQLICSCSSSSSSSLIPRRGSDSSSSSVLFNRHSAFFSYSSEKSNDIFAGERHSLDAPLILERVADFFIGANELDNSSDRMSNGSSPSLPCELVVPVCVGAISAWGEALPAVGHAALRMLLSSVRDLSATHLVRLLQMLAKYLRTVPPAAPADTAQAEEKKKQRRKASTAPCDDAFSCVHISAPAQSIDALVTESIATELLAALCTVHRDLPCVGCCLALRSVCELTAPAITKQLSDSSHRMKRESRIAKRTVVTASGEVQTIIISAAPPIVPLFSSSSSTNDNAHCDSHMIGENAEGVDDMNAETLQRCIAEAVGSRFSATARDMCIQGLCSRVYDFVSSSASSSSASSLAARRGETGDVRSQVLAPEERLVDYSREDAAELKHGLEAKLVLEHVAESLKLVNMLPSSSSSSPAGSSTSPRSNDNNSTETIPSSTIRAAQNVHVSSSSPGEKTESFC